MIDITRLISERPFLVRLFNGTAAKLQERVNSDGFCHTSFGEQGGVRCYGDSHYPRDAAEAAKALALLGDHELALNVLSFHFRHTPPEQRYLPHVLLPDGSIKHNNIQTDTLAHSAMALASCAEAAARTPVPPEKDSRILRLYGECLRFADWLWEDHFHADYSLLDSGNFNEQGFHGSKEALLDIFSNASCYGMFKALEKLALIFSDADAAETAAKRAEMLAQGIEEHLFDAGQGIYRAAVSMAGKKDFPLNWLSVYPYRWYAPRLEPYAKALDMMWTSSANDWNGLMIPTLEPRELQYRTMGKVVASMLGLAARTDDRKRLDILLDFIEKTVTKPENLWPEHWYHHPAPDTEYNRWFFSEFKCWQPFTENPQGDYTVDSGNCEQSAVFVSEILLTGRKAAEKP